LREYYPVALAAFLSKQGGLARPEARAVLAAAPTPRAAARLTLPQIRTALKRAARVRGIDVEAERIKTALRAEQAHQPALVEDAMGVQLLALIGQLDAACRAV